MRPFFSIITVTKNTEKKINLTIRSVLSQNFNNFEYIVIDGYSKDNTFANIEFSSSGKSALYSVICGGSCSICCALISLKRRGLLKEMNQVALTV